MDERHFGSMESVSGHWNELSSQPPWSGDHSGFCGIVTLYERVVVVVGPGHPPGDRTRPPNSCAIAFVERRQRLTRSER